MPINERSKDWYKQNAEAYVRHVRNPDESIYHSLYEKPAMYNMLPDLQGKTVLSLGCGSGEDCHYLAQHHTDKVVGIDITEGLIKAAEAAYPESEYHVMDMEHLEFDDGSFDFAYSSLAIHYLEDWAQAFKEVYRVLKPGSFFLFSCGHPVFSAMHDAKDSEGLRVQELSRTSRHKSNEVTIVGDYMTHQPIVEGIGMAVTTWHKPISEISSEATGSGFLIADISEPMPLAKMKELSPKDYNTLVKIPEFIIFKLIKV